MKYVCREFNPAVCNKRMTPGKVIRLQFGLPDDDVPIDVNDLFMPRAEQERMADYMVRNLTCLGKTVAMREKRMAWIILDIFPRDLEDIPVEASDGAGDVAQTGKEARDE